MGWVSEETFKMFSADFEMGTVWNSATTLQSQRIVNMVSARWASLPWRVGREPVVMDDGFRDLDEGLLGAFAAHCSFKATTRSGFNLSPSDEREDANILSDIPEFTRNVLLSKYVHAKRDRPTQADQSQRGSGQLVFEGNDGIVPRSWN